MRKALFTRDTTDQEIRFKIYKTRRGMQDAFYRASGKKMSAKGICSYNRNHRPSKWVTIYLNEEDLGAGVVSHECYHAAMRIMWPWPTTRRHYAREELFAQLHGNLVRNFWNWWQGGNELSPYPESTPGRTPV